MKPKFFVLLLVVWSMVSLTYSKEVERQDEYLTTDSPEEIAAGNGHISLVESSKSTIYNLEQVATPVINPSNTTYTNINPISVTITCQTLGADIYYTTNGSEPNSSSTKYVQPFTVTPICTLKAIAYENGLNPSNIATAVYGYANAVKIRKFDEQGQEFGMINGVDYNQVNIWATWDNHSDWNPFPSSSLFEKLVHTIKVEQDLIPSKSGTYQKFWKWMTNDNVNSVLNWGTYDLRNKNEFTSYFKAPYTSKIQTALEGFTNLSGDEVFFKDPWKYDKITTGDPKGYTNYGRDASHLPYSSPLTISPTSNLKGVLLGITSSNTGTTYSVKAKTDVTINGIAGKFVDWTCDGKATLINPNSLESGIVFNSPDANVYARYKCVNRSNTSTAFSNTSQRKFVRTDNGYLHLIYESMNHIWYERSTDNGSTWQIMNGGKNLDQGASQSKLPSIATMYNDIAIVWQEQYEGSFYTLKLARFDENSILRYVRELYNSYLNETIYPLYSSNADPVIAFNTSNTVLVCWKKEIPDPQNPWGGIWYKLGQVGIEPYGEISDGSQWYQEGMIPSTTINSYTPAVAPAYLGSEFAIAWEERGYQSSIKFARLEYSQAGMVIDNITQQTVSDWSYCQLHSRPSLALIPSTSGGGKLELGWVGERVYYEYGVQKREKSAFYRRSTYSPSTNSWPWDGTTWHWHYGEVRNVNVNTSTTDGIIAWNEETGTCRYVRSSNVFTTRVFSLYGSSILGSGIQVNNGSDFNSVFGLTLNSSTLPYNFKKSTSVASLGKTGGGEELSSRIAIARLDSAAFFISSSRFNLDGKHLGFTSKRDSIKSYDAESISKALSTEVFTPEANSTISYLLEYGTLDTLYSMKALSKGGGIQCRLELQEDDNGSTLKVLERFSLDRLTMKGNDGTLRKISGSLDVKKFAGRNLKLRLVIEDGINARWGLMESVYSPEEEHQIEKISSEKVVDYALNQNYPNPFNPTTVISYQVPKTSKVLLKIYDMLGKEVSTLVDEVKGEGKYSVEFNASSLPSGIYIYEIRANDFVKSGKMMLLK